MRRSVAVVVGATALAVLAVPACGTKTDPAAGPTTTTGATPSGEKKVFKEDDREIHVLSGEKFGIRVDENSSIGDQWKVVSDPDPSFLEAEGDSFKPDPDADPEATGAGGQREFKYKARRAGTTTITLYNCYRCGTDGKVAPENEPYAERLTFTVTVS